MKKAILLFVVLSLACVASVRTRAQDASAVAFINVNVIPMDKERVLKNQTVIVRNPLENVENTERRAGVMLNGRWFTQTQLDKWLDEIAPRFQRALDH